MTPFSGLEGLPIVRAPSSVPLMPWSAFVIVSFFVAVYREFFWPPTDVCGFTEENDHRCGKSICYCWQTMRVRGLCVRGWAGRGGGGGGRGGEAGYKSFLVYGARKRFQHPFCRHPERGCGRVMTGGGASTHTKVDRRITCVLITPFDCFLIRSWLILDTHVFFTPKVINLIYVYNNVWTIFIYCLKSVFMKCREFCGEINLCRGLLPV